MNARPHEPFDAEETAAARAYRALPGGEPSPELDARILAQARTAVSAPSRRRARPWFLGAGFGTAAAAVMAAGIAWQLGWLGSVPGSTTVPTSPRDMGAASQSVPARQEEVERVEIEYVKSESKAADDAPMPPAAPAAPPPPPPPPEFRRRENAKPAPEASADKRDAAPAIIAPAPEPFPAEVAEADTALGAAAASGAAEREQQPLAAPQAAPATARGVGLAKQIAALPPWAEDADLEPEAWLERIRDRVQRGDRQGAEFSLRRFVLMHPQRDVPRELQRLLVE